MIEKLGADIGEKFKATLTRISDRLAFPGISHELTAESYLATLTESDRTHVSNLVNFVGNMDQSLNLGIAVTAVGSTVWPEAERFHAPDDIDIRILNCMPPGSDERKLAITRIKNRIRGYLLENQIPFTESGSTVKEQMVKTTKGDYVAYLYDAYNNDPSFVAEFADGLPVHISFSGLNNFDTVRYLKAERKHHSNFSVLYQK